MQISKMIKNETIREVVLKLLKAGWQVKSRNCHLKLFNDDTRKTITVPLSPSDSRSALNWICQIKRCGVVIPC